MTTPKLGFTELASATASKFATVNENLRKSEIFMMPTVMSIGDVSPPVSPSEGDAYIVGPSPSGFWLASSEGEVAAFINGGWTFFIPDNGWQFYVVDINRSVMYTGGSWVFLDSIVGSPSGSTLSFLHSEEELTLSGASVESIVAFPNQCSIVGVTARVTEEITGVGVTSVNIGPTGGVPTKLGTGIGLTVGSTSQGTNGSFEGNYAETTVTITPNSGTFTSGKIRICLWYAVLGVPSN